jgi:DNA-binding CsgD family transcriptional regulator
MKKLLKGELPPETRLKYLTKLCAFYWNIDPDTSLIYGMDGKTLFNSDVPLHRIGRHQFVLGMAWENKGNFDSALFYLRQAEETCLKAHDTLYQYRALEQTGSLYRIMGKYDTAVILMNRSLDYFRSRQKQHQIMSTLFNIGSVYLEQNRYSRALQYYLESASYDSVLADSASEAAHKLAIGNIYLNLGTLFKTADPEKSKNYLALSKNYYYQSLPVFQAINMKTGYYFTLMSLQSAMIASGKLREADSLLNNCKDCLSFPDPRVHSGFSINQATVLHLRGNDREAMDILAKVSRIRNEIMILPEYHRAMLLYASLLWNGGQSDTAFRVAVQSLSWARAHSVMPVALEACEILAGWERKQNNNSKAFEYLEMSGKYQDSLYREIGRETFDQLEFSYSNRILKAEIGKLTIEKKYNNTITFIVILIASFLIVLFSILTLYLQRRHKGSREKSLLAEERARLAEEESHHKEMEVRNVNLENQLKQEEIVMLQLEMQLREQELVSQTMLNAELNQKNLNFSEKLNPFQQKFVKKKDQDEFSQTLSSIRSENQGEPMQHFDMIFKQMHGNFLEKLIECCPDLTKTELQICSLLRLNLSSKEIARLMNINPASIDGTRHRIRKKLNIDPEASLTSYLIALK